MSVQASKYHYCDPRDDVGPWTKVEVGFPSRELPELKGYGDGDTVISSNIFGFVPIELIEKIIEENGGIGNGEE